MVNFGSCEKKVWSQNGEDGVIAAIFALICTTSKFYVEFGASGENNTALLREQGWNGVWMDQGDCPPAHKEFITAENINDLLAKYQVPVEFDILSIDIDGNDYWVWKAIKHRPRVVVIEFNGYLDPAVPLTIKYNPNHQWNHDSYFGASVAALQKLGKEKGYKLAYVDFNLVNLFFIREDITNEDFYLYIRRRTDRIKHGEGQWHVVE